MKRTLLLISTWVGLGTMAWAQHPVDKTVSLESVEIQGKRMSELTGGAIKRLQVSDNLSAVTGTTSDLFRQLPSVVTDIEGGISYRGSNQLGILINGVPYGLMEEQSGDFLIQMPALFFERISVTATPSIRWIPDGEVGLLNMTSAAYRASDSPLMVTLGAGFQERYNAGAVLNLHPGRFHIIGKYNYRREYRKRNFSKTTTNQKGTTVMQNQATARPDVHVADLQVGYDLTSQDLVSIYGLFTRMDYSRYGKIHNNKRVGEQLKPVMFRHRHNDQLQDAFAVETRWLHTFDNPKEQLTLLFNYNNFGYEEDNYYKNEKPESGKIVAEELFDVNQEKHHYYLSALYQTSWADDWNLQLGYIGRFKHENYSAAGEKKAADHWQSDPVKENEYLFDRRTQLLLAALDKRWGNWQVEVGVQGELNWQQIQTLSSQGTERFETDRHTRFHLFPRLKVDYRLNPTGGFTLNYMERVIRPNGSLLNNFCDRSNATHVWVGNPDLKDERIHTVEWGYTYVTSTFRLAPSLYFRHKKDRIMDLLMDTGEGGIWKKMNIGKSHSWGIELAASWRPIPILSIRCSGDLYRDEIDGRTIGYGEKKSLVCGDVKGAVSVQITPTTELQLDGFYISDQLTPQGKIKHRSCVNVGLSQYFMQRKLRANLSVNNLFNGLEETTIVDTPSLQMMQVRNRDAQVTWITLTYLL